MRELDKQWSNKLSKSDEQLLVSMLVKTFPLRDEEIPHNEELRMLKDVLLERCLIAQGDHLIRLRKGIKGTRGIENHLIRRAYRFARRYCKERHYIRRAYEKALFPKEAIIFCAPTRKISIQYNIIIGNEYIWPKLDRLRTIEPLHNKPLRPIRISSMFEKANQNEDLGLYLRERKMIDTAAALFHGLSEESDGNFFSYDRSQNLIGTARNWIMHDSICFNQAVARLTNNGWKTITKYL